VLTTERSGPIALTDCDVVCLADPRALLSDAHALHAKPVDLPNPPLAILDTVLQMRGLPPGDTAVVPLAAPERTYVGNANSGLYVGEASHLQTLAEPWAREARWLMDRLHVLERWRVHVDQVAMLLTLLVSHTRFHPLPIGANLPTHVGAIGAMPEEVIGPVSGIHYHDLVTPQGLLRPTGFPWVDAAIGRANAAIAEELREFFPNVTFWTWRYKTDPDLGSGVGSRGASLVEKRDLIGLIAAGLQPRTTLDVGCGDGAAVNGIELGLYLGLDVAPNAGSLLADGKTVEARSISIADRADLSLCLDVSIHESSRRTWESLIAAVVGSARSVALVSGYERPPEQDSVMVHFHRPLSEALAEYAHGRWVVPVRDHHEITTFAVLTPPSDPHPRDIRLRTLARLPPALLLGPELVALLECAWQTTGFYPDHLPRLWEYPQALRLLRRTVPAGGTLLDVGAGINPLVPMLRRLGFRITTVDRGPEVCDPNQRTRWNEWGFLDYARLGLDITCVQGTLADLPVDARYDAAIAISVIEHLEAAERRTLLRDVRSRCRPGAHVLLTIDIFEGTDRIWNRCEGREVEGIEQHGCWSDLLDELGAAGFEVLESTIARYLGRSPVDTGLLLARPSASGEGA
jgi:SAM-dependent methyltransferase